MFSPPVGSAPRSIPCRACASRRGTGR
jgi:hypothetical protein